MTWPWPTCPSLCPRFLSLPPSFLPLAFLLASSDEPSHCPIYGLAKYARFLCGQAPAPLPFPLLHQAGKAAVWAPKCLRGAAAACTAEVLMGAVLVAAATRRKLMRTLPRRIARKGAAHGR